MKTSFAMLVQKKADVGKLQNEFYTSMESEFKKRSDFRNLKVKVDFGSIL